MIFTRPTKPTLRSYAPTPTTVSYNVSTRPAIASVTARTLLFLSVTLRISLCLFAFLLVYAKKLSIWAVPPPTIERTSTITTVYSQQYLDALLHPSNPLLGLYIYPITCAIAWPVLILTTVLAIWLLIRRGHTTESLLVLRGLGVQTSTTSSTYLTGSVTRFIPTTEIQDIFIHEAFKGFEVRFYLAIVVKGEESVVVVFPNLLPKREILEEVWRGAKACLYEAKS